MQLDKTKIAVRQRSWLELVDLSLVVVREFWAPIVQWSLLGAIPFALLNLVLLYRVLDYENLMLQAPIDASLPLLRLRYVYLMAALVFLETPLALLGATYFLGQAVFVERPDWREVVRSLRSRLSTSALVLGIYRMGLLGLVAVLLIPNNTLFSPWVELGLMGFILLGGSVGVRSVRPFAPEILVLEQCPLTIGKTGGRVSYRQRICWLHSALSGDLLGQFLMMSIILFATCFILTISEMTVIGLLFGRWEWGWWIDWIFLPVNLWLMAIWVTIYRFLSYLDARIRLEGWEIELRFLAEAQRLEGLV